MSDVNHITISQNTGNPVLDSMVNIMANTSWGGGSEDNMKKLHAILLELAQKEPGGLRCHKDTLLMRISPDES